MLELAHLITAIGERFRNSPPNGLLLGWREDRYFDEVRGCCPGCTVVNETSFDYSRCNTFQIRPQSLTDQWIYELSVNISFVAAAYTIHWTKYSPDARRGRVVDTADVEVAQNPAAAVRRMLKMEGFTEIPGEWLESLVAGVDLELAESATLGKCLFNDYE